MTQFFETLYYLKPFVGDEMFKFFGIFSCMLLLVGVAKASPDNTPAGQYKCENVDAADLNNQLQEVRKTGMDSHPSLMSFGKDSVSVTYGPTGFQETTNYWGEWKKGDGAEIF